MDILNLTADRNNVYFRCVEDCNEAIMITNLAGRLVYVNPSWVRIYGFSREEALASTPRILHSGYHNKDFYQKMWANIACPALGFWKGEVVNKAKDGTVIPVLLTITPVRGEKQEIIGHMGIALDMSAEKQLEAKVLQADRLASIGILASGLAHEIGTPLGVVRGRAELMMMQAQAMPDAESESPIASGLQTIISQIDRISKLIKSLLRFSRSTDDVRMQDVDIAAVTQEIVNLLGQTFRASGIEFRAEISSGSIIYADFNRMQQVLLNLIVNSVHAIQSAKALSMPREAHYIRLSVRGKSLILEDTGTGIPPENMRKLFQPFFTTKDVGQGTGLGLAIVSKLMHEMSGAVHCESSYGKGTTFTLSFSA